MPKDPHEPILRTWNLHNGITLTIRYAAKKPPTAAAMEDFLAKAMMDFKERRDKLHEQTYTGGAWESYAIDGRTIRSTGILEHPEDEAGNDLSTDSWVKAIIVAYSAANTLTQMQEQFDAYKAHATPGDWITQVIEALGRRNGDMDAFELMMQHQLRTQSA
jgi:hypothetical protein